MTNVLKITDKFDYFELDDFTTKKLEGMVIRKNLKFPGSDVYLVKPHVYKDWKINRRLTKEFLKEISKPMENLLKKYGSITVRTCFRFKGFENPRALPSWRNLKTKRSVINSIQEAYMRGEEIAKENRISKYDLGLLVQGRLNAEKGGFAIADIEKEKMCMIDACWGDANLIAMGEEGFDTFWIDEKGKIIEKVIRNKNFGYFYKGTERKKVKIDKQKGIKSSLTNEEAIKISNHVFRAAKKYNCNIETEFMITKNGLIDIYELQMKPGFTIFKPEDSITEKDVILKGLSAYLGKVSGKVKIIKDLSDFKKISEGDIAVIDKKMMSVALPILTKVSAVITDTGGITSHFATVTKEFKIPCIVGTHKATKILKNGQKIFVDANRGEVYSKIPKIDEFGIDQDVVWFTESGKRLNLIGTKALNLITMIQLGLPVPSGFVITTKAFSDFLKENKIENEIKKILSEVDFEKLDENEEKIRLLFKQTDIPNDLEKNIIDSFNKLRKKYQKVSVRSSATCEDSVKASFAGQFDSFLFIDDKDNLLRSIKNCWLSKYRSGVFVYANRLGINPRNIQMAVVVQGMIDADKSGVMFTKNVWGEKDTILIEASKGIGENVVSGTKTPDRYIIDKKTGKIIDKTVEGKGVLTDKEISGLIKYARILEDYYTHPQDIEWAIKDGEIYLLQSRPITT